MTNPKTLEFRKVTAAEFQVSLYKLSISELNSKLDDFNNYGLIEDCEIIQKVLNEKINQIVTTIEHD